MKEIIDVDSIMYARDLRHCDLDPRNVIVDFNAFDIENTSNSQTQHTLPSVTVIDFGDAEFGRIRIDPPQTVHQILNVSHRQIPLRGIHIPSTPVTRVQRQGLGFLRLDRLGLAALVGGRIRTHRGRHNPANEEDMDMASRISPKPTKGPGRGGVLCKESC